MEKEMEASIKSENKFELSMFQKSTYNILY
jgi:hypothetical protein